jgi:conjugative relaxase-like TrwC/TraI family protein
MRFKGQSRDLREIASALHTRTILDGSVRRAGGRVRIVAQLIDVEDDTHLWSETYDRELTDIFKIQDEIANAIVAAMRGSLGAGQADSVAALFTHDTSRALDPHLHTHCIVFNATHDPEERRWKALQNQEMLKARKYVEAVYYHELAKDLRRFGYRIRNRARGDFELDGISDEMCERFSKRHDQIDDAQAALLRMKPELAEARDVR